MTTALKQKLASIEADLISASALGTAHLHAEAFRKFAELDMDSTDLAAVMDALVEEQEKQAFFGTPGFGQALTLGALLAPPLAAGAGMLMDKMKRSAAFNNLMKAVPELAQRDPQRVSALFDLVWTASPSVAANTLVAADIIKQLMAMPMVDLGTVGKLIDLAKSKSVGGGLGDAVGSGFTAAKNVSSIGPTLMPGSFPGKAASAGVKVAHVATDGTPCVLDWGTEACKTAGITDAFMGSGTNLEQANNAFQAGQDQMGSGLLPLDNVVKELLAKEQELAQREEIIAQREQEMAQMQQMMQQMGSQYMDQTGVDPNTGDVAETPDDGAEAEPQDAGEQPEGGDDAAVDPTAGADGAPAAPEMQPADGESYGEAPSGLPEDAPAEADSSEQPMPEAGVEGMPPVADEDAPDASEPLPAVEAGEGESDEQPGEGTEGEGAEGAEGAEGEQAEGAEGEQAEGAEGEQAEGAEGAEGEQAVPPQLPDPMIGAPAGEAGVDAAEANSPYAGAGQEPEAGEQPAEGEEPAGEQPAEGEEPVEGEDDEDEKPEGGEESAGGTLPGNEDGEHDEQALSQGLAGGPNTPESVNGTPEDEMHDAINKVPGEGSDEDNIADAELAAVMNAGGHEPGDQAAPAPAPAAAMGGVQPSADGGHEITLPLRISIKIGEAEQPVQNETRESARAALAALFEP